MRVLIVEDNIKLNETVKEALCDEYALDCCFDGEEALLYIDMAEYDAIILDLMLPKVNGIDVLKKLRAKGNNTPVLILTALDSVFDKVKGLDMGADDYLTKPFSIEELCARIRVMIRRGPVNTENILKIPPLEINCQKRTVLLNGKNIEMTKREFDILEYMARNKNIPLQRERIVSHISNFNYDGASNLIDVYIRRIRTKIGDDDQTQLIFTVRGVGYVLRAENV